MFQVISFYNFPCAGLYLRDDESSQACQIWARDLQRFEVFLFSLSLSPSTSMLDAY